MIGLAEKARALGRYALMRQKNPQEKDNLPEGHVGSRDLERTPLKTYGTTQQEETTDDRGLLMQTAVVRPLPLSHYAFSARSLSLVSTRHDLRGVRLSRIFIRQSVPFSARKTVKFDQIF